LYVNLILEINQVLLEKGSDLPYSTLSSCGPTSQKVLRECLALQKAVHDKQNASLINECTLTFGSDVSLDSSIPATKFIDPCIFRYLIDGGNRDSNCVVQSKSALLQLKKDAEDLWMNYDNQADIIVPALISGRKNIKKSIGKCEQEV